MPLWHGSGRCASRPPVETSGPSATGGSPGTTPVLQPWPPPGRGARDAPWLHRGAGGPTGRGRGLAGWRRGRGEAKHGGAPGLDAGATGPLHPGHRADAGAAPWPLSAVIRGWSVCLQAPATPWAVRLRHDPVGTVHVDARQFPDVRDHRGTICVTCEQGLTRSLAEPAWVGRSSPDLRGSLPLDTLAALRYKTHM